MLLLQNVLHSDVYIARCEVTYTEYCPLSLPFPMASCMVFKVSLFMLTDTFTLYFFQDFGVGIATTPVLSGAVLWLIMSVGYICGSGF